MAGTFSTPKTMGLAFCYDKTDVSVAAELGPSRCVILMKFLSFGPSLCTPYGLYEAKSLTQHHFGPDFTVLTARKSKTNLPMLAVDKCKMPVFITSSTKVLQKYVSAL